MRSLPLTRSLAGLPALLLPALCALALSGCFGGISLPDEEFMVEYASPEFTGRQRLNEVLKISKFTPAEAALDVSMVRRTGRNKRENYPNAWWKVHPGYLVTDHLLRDLRRSELYQAVFSYRDDVDARYALAGTVEEFIESDSDGKPQALLTVAATLLDRNAKQDPSKGVVFQKTYRIAEPLSASAPASLASGMSRALERFSRAIQEDLYNAIRTRIKPE
ncbi:MAG: ABC-type transport auxiliary lipoprotein family protein [Nitrospirota bacterium]|nr:ABC-type transport auxiliary lipoprotein family protein [Nitrospirota bacterium]